MNNLHGNCKINKIPCHIDIKKDFYEWVLKIVEPKSAGLKKIPGTIRVNVLLDKIKTHIPEIDQTNDNSFDFNTVYEDLTKLKYLHGNCMIKKIQYETKRRKREFYEWVLKIVEPEFSWHKKNPGDIKVNTLLEKIKPYVQEVDKLDVQEVDKQDDNTFDFNTVYADLIEMKNLHGACNINKIPYKGKIRKDFYNWVLKIVKPEDAGFKQYPGRIRVNTLLDKMEARRN